MSNEVINSVDQFIDQAVETLNKLNGLPGYALVTLACLVFGYVLKASKRFPNNGIPVAVVLAGAILNSLIAEVDAIPMRVWIVKNALVGGVCGFIAFLSHHLVLGKLEERIKKWIGVVPLLALCCSMLAASGCVSVHSGDPIVVNAERTLAASFEAVDAFLVLEYRNRATVAARAPALLEVANDIRRTAPSIFERARVAVQNYKRRRDALARQAVESRVDEAQATATRAALASTQIKIAIQ